MNVPYGLWLWLPCILLPRHFKSVCNFFLQKVLKLVWMLSSQVPPDHQSLDVNQEPTALVHTAASVDSCPLCLSPKILLLLFLNFRAEDPLEFVDTELRGRTDQVWCWPLTNSTSREPAIQPSKISPLSQNRDVTWTFRSGEGKVYQAGGDRRGKCIDRDSPQLRMVWLWIFWL